MNPAARRHGDEANASRMRTSVLIETTSLAAKSGDGGNSVDMRMLVLFKPTWTLVRFGQRRFGGNDSNKVRILH